MHTSGHEAISTKGQGGAALLLFIVGALLATATVFALRLILPASRGATQAQLTAASFETIQNAIVAYVAANGSLPCPANPAPVNDGISDPALPAATTTCNSPSGIVPWATLGISSQAAIDGWNRRISYRVFDGVTGLTQPLGASMTNCDTLYPYGPPPLALASDGLCDPNHFNTVAQYLTAKGFTVNDGGTLKTSIAYVLISHGESGLGAYMPGGNRITPLPISIEAANTNSGGPFYRAAHSATATDPTTAAHFDDVVAWMTISDLAKKAGRNARDWQDSGATVQISAATLTNMTTPGPGHFNATTAPSGQTFSGANTIPNPTNANDTLVFGGNGGTTSANCAWWPTGFKLYNGIDRYALRLYLEFSTADASVPFGGFTVGFLSKSATDSFIDPDTGVPISLTASCGDATTDSDLGWGNGQTLPPTGKLQPPRFAGEFDAKQDSAVYNDPASNHLSIDFTDVLHGSSAATCSLASDTYHNNGVNDDCYTGPSNTWLRSGLSNFHRMRVEVIPRDPACSAGAAPRLKIWVLPQTVCPAGATDAVCSSAQVLDSAYAPAAPLPAGVIAIESCIPAPAPANSLDNLYFGITAASRSQGVTLYLRNLSAAAFLTP